MVAQEKQQNRRADITPVGTEATSAEILYDRIIELESGRAKDENFKYSFANIHPVGELIKTRQANAREAVAIAKSKLQQLGESEEAIEDNLKTRRTEINAMPEIQVFPQIVPQLPHVTYLDTYEIPEIDKESSKPIVKTRIGKNGASAEASAWISRPARRRALPTTQGN